jgi:hypothetical protein
MKKQMFTAVKNGDYKLLEAALQAGVPANLMEVFNFSRVLCLVILSLGCSVISVAFITFMCIFFTYATYLADLHSLCRIAFCNTSRCYLIK